MRWNIKSLVKKYFLIVSIFLIAINHTPVYAQEKMYGDPLKDVTIVGAAAAFGAVLGLSTLPFTEEPGDHMKNVLVGGAIGLILGVAWVAYSQARTTQNYSLYEKSERDFIGADRASLMVESSKKNFDPLGDDQYPPSVQYSFQF